MRSRKHHVVTSSVYRNCSFKNEITHPLTVNLKVKLLAAVRSVRRAVGLQMRNKFLSVGGAAEGLICR